MNKAVLIHVPHSSAKIPPEERDSILIDDDSLFREKLRMTDWYTDELFCVDGPDVQKNSFSRLLFDPERFRDDRQEIMSKFGMGAIYTKTLDGRKLRNLTVKKREEMIRKYYDPYHFALAKKVEELLEKFGKCLIIDGHSFPDSPLAFESDKTSVRPDICIGTDEYHTPEALARVIEEYVKDNGLTVRRNFPFAGTIVPMKYYKSDKRVSSVMLEVNRRLYINEETGEKNSRFDMVSSVISKLVLKLCELQM